MKPGDLIKIRNGCGDEGKLGIIIFCHPMQSIIFYDVLLSGEVQSHVNGYWLELLNEGR